MLLGEATTNSLQDESEDMIQRQCLKIFHSNSTSNYFQSDKNIVQERSCSPSCHRCSVNMSRRSISTYISDWEDPRIGPNVLREFYRICPVQDALNDYRESTRRMLASDGTSHHIAGSRDSQNNQFTSAD